MEYSHSYLFTYCLGLLLIKKKSGMAHKAENAYPLALYIKSVPILNLELHNPIE